ncbi:SRPBCC family protein [Cumulibacter manganitolerans]|uniref:SRPBCC family protein n=1 Tax=Cumulibacter manganitolerans TaxID=1884992 RepID=UPI0012977B60|nr:SRPBCC family protein [Cumulibacter manganitolerans]
MRLHSSFVIGRGVDEVLDAVLDLERASGCVPGARVVGTHGAEHVEGELRLKVGPLVATYAGSAQLQDISRQDRTFALRARGREMNGLGPADALVRVRLSAADGGTRVDLDTDLSIRGKAAEYGRGAIGELAERGSAELAANLERMIAERAAERTEPATPAGTSPAPPADAEGTPPGRPARATLVAIAGQVVAAAVAATAAAYVVVRLAGRRR